MVSLVLEDAIKVMVDYEMSKKRNKKDIDTGYFRCIYKSKWYLFKFYLKIILNNMKYNLVNLFLN